MVAILNRALNVLDIDGTLHSDRNIQAINAKQRSPYEDEPSWKNHCVSIGNIAAKNRGRKLFSNRAAKRCLRFEENTKIPQNKKGCLKTGS